MGLEVGSGLENEAGPLLGSLMLRVRKSSRSGAVDLGSIHMVRTLWVALGVR